MTEWVRAMFDNLSSVDPSHGRSFFSPVCASAPVFPQKRRDHTARSLV